MSKRSCRLLIPMVSVLLGCFGITVVNADSAREDADQPSVNTSPGEMAGRVFINPKTGKLSTPPPGLTPAELPIALQNKLSRSSEGLETRTLPNGTLLLNLQDRFQNMIVLRTTSSGEHQVSCSDSTSDVEHALGNDSCPVHEADEGAP